MNSQLWRWCHLDYFQRHWDHHKFSHGCQPTACSWGRFSAIQLGGWDASGEADWEQGKWEGEKTGGRAKDCWLPALSLLVPLCSVARRLGNIFLTLYHLILWSRLALQVIALPHCCGHDHAWLCPISYLYIQISSVCSSHEKWTVSWKTIFWNHHVCWRVAGNATASVSFFLSEVTTRIEKWYVSWEESL